MTHSLGDARSRIACAEQRMSSCYFWIFNDFVVKYCHSRCWTAVYRESAVSSRDDVIKWKHFPRYWPFVRGIHRSPVNSPHKGQWRGALMFSLICASNKRLSKQSWGWWFDTPSRSLWRHSNGKHSIVLCSRYTFLAYPSNNNCHLYCINTV